MTTVTVNAAALKQVLQALIGPGHLIRELQCIHGMHEMLKKPGDDPVGTLLTEYNTWAQGENENPDKTT